MSHELIQDLLLPKAEFTPIPFWFINDDLKEETLKAQLVDFKDKGVDGVVVHPRIGISKTIGYLSDTYFSFLKFIVKTASELKMQIVLYDEGMYPSGSAKGGVVKANPDFASLGLALCQNPVEGKVIFEYEDGWSLVEQKSGGTIRGIHFGEDDGEAEAPLSADILNPEAVQKFIELVYDSHYAHLGDYFGTTIIGMFTDEPDPLGRNTKEMFDWTCGLEAEILAAGGDLSQLRALFEGSENTTTRIYQKIVRNRLNHVYYKSLHDWCEERGVQLMGHPAASDDIDEEIYFHVPGQDLIFRKMSPEAGGIYGLDSVQGKVSADAARHLGRRRNSNECFGVCVKDQIPWYFTGQDMKWYLDWLAVRGVNLFIPHAFYYSVRGARKDERPPDVGPHNIWWPYYRQFSDYIKRLSYVMTDSEHVCEVAILCESKQVPYAEVIPLFENQIGFDYLPKSFLALGSYDYAHVFDVADEHFAQDISKLVKNRTDFQTKDFCPGLRVMHVKKSGADMYFVFNEGKESVDTEVTVPVLGQPVFVDLWRNDYYGVNSIATEKTTSFSLQLRAFESLLVVISEEEMSRTEPLKTTIGDLTDQFQLMSQNNIQFKKTYLAAYEVPCIKGNETFFIRGEEMAECFCNGEFAGVSFASPHYFHIGKFLQVGPNELKVVLTGNAANKFGNVTIPYGLEKGSMI